MLDAILLLASAAPGEEETSKTAFYVAGGILAAWAVLVGAYGMSQEDGPSEGAGRTIIGVTALLVVATMATSIATG